MALPPVGFGANSPMYTSVPNDAGSDGRDRDAAPSISKTAGDTVKVTAKTKTLVIGGIILAILAYNMGWIKL